MEAGSRGESPIWATSDGFVSAVLAQARIGIAFFDTQGRFVYINRVLAEMNGLAPIDHLGRTVEEVLPGIAAGVMPVLERALRGEHVNFELTGETAAAPGVTRTWSEEFFPAPSADGSVIGAVAMVREMTEQLRHEAEIAERSAELAAVFETAPVGLALFDRSLNLVRMNRLLASWHDLAPAAFIGQHTRDMFPDLWPRTAEHYERALSGKESSAEFAPSGLRGAGAPASVVRAYSPVMVRDRVVGVVVTVSDVTTLVERERAAQRATRVQEEVRRLASHEIATPLTAVIGMAQRLERVAARTPQAPIGEAQEDLLLIRAEAERIGRILNSIASAVELDEGKLELRREPIVLGELFDRAVRIVHERHRDFLVDVAVPEPIVVHSDGDKLLEILLNLLENAAKYADGHASIRLHPPSIDATSSIEVVVTDNGPGIPPEEQARIFERGYRGSGSSRAAGSGLGLHYARALARVLGGDLTLAAEGAGAAFCLRLPAQAKN